jgi:hypothetical protein
LRFPSVSADPKYKPEVFKKALSTTRRGLCID